MKPKIFKTKEDKDRYLRRWALRLKTKGMTVNAIWNRFNERGITIGYKKVKSLIESKENDKELLK